MGVAENSRRAMSAGTSSFTSRAGVVTPPPISRRNSMYASLQRRARGNLGSASFSYFDGVIVSRETHSAVDWAHASTSISRPTHGHAGYLQASTELEKSDSSVALPSLNFADEKKNEGSLVRPYSFSSPMESPDEKEELIIEAKEMV